MKKAMNNGRMVDILKSNENGIYHCPVCNEKLKRKFGNIRQYFAHRHGEGDECELKLSKMLEEENNSRRNENIDIPDEFKECVEIGLISLEDMREMGYNICIYDNSDKQEVEDVVEEKVENNNIRAYMEQLKEHFYDNTFDNVEVELSDYMSEEGFYLTKEQKDIIFSNENRIKVSAAAGSAKTSTLYYYCKERPHKKILYLVYNKAMKDEALHTFGKLSNVTIKTTHGLAYGEVGKFYRNKLTFNYGVVDIIRDLNLDWKRDKQLAVNVDKCMKMFMASDVDTFDELGYEIEDEIDYFTKEVKKKNFTKRQLLNNCEKLWELKKNYKNNVKVEHDFYLKLFQLRKVDMSNLYDIVAIDEIQDSTMLTFDLLINSNIKGQVIIGDKFQSLYKWRGSINIIPLFKGKEYKLTTSFRVSQNIANISNILIKDFTGEDIGMKGFNSKQKIVEKIDKTKQHACLCRTNSYIFQELCDRLEMNKNCKFFFEGGFQSYNFQNIKDAYYFSMGHDVKNTLLQKFKNYYDMKHYGDDIGDLEIISLTTMVDKYGSNIPHIIDGIRNNSVTDRNKADVVFTTIHRSKGLTLKMPMVISNDHFDVLTNLCLKESNDENYDPEKVFEEMCILYVAITRCAGEIELSSNLNQYLLSKINN
jgi:F-box protein 18 (helicase)